MQEELSDVLPLYREAALRLGSEARFGRGKGADDVCHMTHGGSMDVDCLNPEGVRCCEVGDSKL